MTATAAASAAYIVAGLLFVLALAGLSRHETAKAGNGFGIAGMAIALAATIGLATRSISALGITLLVAAMVVGAAVGLWRVAGWARGPVVVLQLLLAALAYTTAFEAGQPAIGLPVLVLIAVELYLLATPESRLAYAERTPGR